VLFFFMGGVSFPGILSAGGSLVANRRLHRLLFVYTPTDVTSNGKPRRSSDKCFRDHGELCGDCHRNI